jgi:hypothetical protein
MLSTCSNYYFLYVQKTIAPRKKNTTIVQQQPILNKKIATAKSALQQIEKGRKTKRKKKEKN